jgi:hypothetical protein
MELWFQNRTVCLVNMMDVQLQSLSDGLYLLIIRNDSGELILNKRFVKAQ